MNDFDGVGALVTGGAGGIGAATAALLRARGAQVAVLDLNTDGAPDGVHAVRCDITDPTEVDRAVGVAVGLLGSLDVLVNNAGIGAVGDIAGNGDAEWALYSASKGAVHALSGPPGTAPLSSVAAS
ncbi:SDR family NAD(P)-dependent oxidoreductase [Streptomyces sp. NPDC004539]|uniref:SDR family NAD(P)-dependent oxidoreductase n=1 Tax=Streptomyces sp. NPDC004539 TaxID=3154280 RepID=UPI0033BB6FCA